MSSRRLSVVRYGGTTAILLAACFGWLQPAAAEPAHALQLGSDLAWTSARDDVLAPTVFSGPRCGVEPRYFARVGMETYRTMALVPFSSS